MSPHDGDDQASDPCNGTDDDLLNDTAVAIELMANGCQPDDPLDDGSSGSIGWRNSKGYLFYMPKPCTRKILRERLAYFRSYPHN